MKELKVFGRVHKYNNSFDDIIKDTKTVEKLAEEIRKPQILSYCGMETVEIRIAEDHNFICHDCIKQIYEQHKEKLNETGIRECLLKCSTEDAEWTEQRNKGLTGIFYRKITFLPEIQEEVCNKLNNYLQNLYRICEEMTIEEQKQQTETDMQKKEWQVKETFKNIRPTDGEDGTDGYFDAEYISKDGEAVRMIERDVFDVGCYSYPKRLEGTDSVFDKTLWTEAEKKLCLWLSVFGQFKTTRM